MDDEFPISYEGVSPGVPVLTRDGKQFGFLEHVLEVAEEDIFEGIVVWVGSGSWMDRRIQRDLSQGHLSAARRLEAFRHQDLRFVEADKVAAITVGYIRCDLDLSEAGRYRRLPARRSSTPTRSTRPSRRTRSRAGTGTRRTGACSAGRGGLRSSRRLRRVRKRPGALTQASASLKLRFSFAGIVSSSPGATPP